MQVESSIETGVINYHEEIAGNFCIRVGVAIVSSYSDCTAESYIDLQSMGVEIGYYYNAMVVYYILLYILNY